MKRQRQDEVPSCAMAPDDQPATNRDCPVRKLTTGLLGTYKAINQLYYQQKRSITRNCELWHLLNLLTRHIQMLKSSGEELEFCWGRFTRDLWRWEWGSRGMEAVSYTHLTLPTKRIV
eukprot:TRINITY_DN31050_c0_g1_i1.p2 TRINITY_DN31050_c0_g1~~TRINITY_DN31050_c0_g1_i1.p2  ORF type:complete len:118 (-),score=19.78 TRINITY_DN31050_c0_g1_i1:109-462(-)